MPVEPPVVSPRPLAEAYAVLAGSRSDPIAGGTDLMVALTGELGEPPRSGRGPVGARRPARDRCRGDAIVLGALTTYTDIRRSPLCREHLPALVEAAATIGAAQIQNRGTLGGNVVNASPAGDTLPVLLAADAHVRPRLGPGGARRCRPTEFWTGYRGRRWQPMSSLLRIRVPARGRARACGSARSGRAARSRSARSSMALGWRDGDRPGGTVDRRPAGTRVRGGHPDPRAADRGGPRGLATRRPRPPTAPPRRSPASSSPSTTSAPPPSTAGSSPPGSCIGSSARPAAGDHPPTRHRPRGLDGGRSTASRPGPSRPPWRRCSRERRGSSGAWRWPARSARASAMFARAREIAHAMPRRRADRAHRCPSTPRRAAGDACRALSYVEQGVRPRARRRRRGHRARSAQRRVRGPLRVPLLRLRRRPFARGAPPRDGRRARGRSRRRDPRALDAVVDIARDRHTTLTAARGGRAVIELGANRYGKAAIRLVRVARGPDGDRFRDLTVAIALEGDFDGRPHRRRQLARSWPPTP